MKLRMGMIYAQRVLLCGDVVAQCEVQFVESILFPRDRGDRIVRHAVCLSEDKSIFVCVGAPCLQDVVGKVDDALCIFPAEADDRERPFHDACGDILIALHGKFFDDQSLGHGECIISSLEMVMTQNRTAHNGKVGIGPEEIVGEELDKIKQLCKCVPVDLHGDMLTVEDDAVFIIINVRRVLESPFCPLDGDGDDPVVFPCGVVCASCITFIFHTELAFRIG